MQRFVITMVFSLATFLAWSQQVERPAIKILSKATSRSIKLRWAPNTSTLWKFVNKYGCTIERTVLTENNQIKKDRTSKTLNVIPIKPAERKQWERSMEKDDYVAVAAQAIFGESFEVTQDHTNEILKIVNKAKELESRFSFALFAADQSLEAASLSGLYFEDETVFPNEKYLYRIFANIPTGVHPADTGFVFVGLSDYKPLPAPQNLNVVGDNHIALVSWDGRLVEKIYNSFWLERSEDGKSFRRVTDNPIVNTFQGVKPKTNLIFKTDSIPQNKTRYYYRVLGVDSFGDVGPASDTVSVVARPAFDYKATIESHRIDSTGFVSLHFSFPNTGTMLLRSFDLTRQDITSKTISTILPSLSDTCRYVMDVKPNSSNYYCIRAIDVYGRQTMSFPYFVQLEDSIPPQSPTGLKGRIDSLGYVYLEWEAGTETDIRGYSLYRANFLSDEFIRLPGSVIEGITFVDTVALDNLSEKIYYKLAAHDRRYNSSQYSPVLELKKPDLIAPIEAVFTAIKYDSSGIKLRWIASGSADVATHLLYRKESSEEDWSLLKIFENGDTVTSFMDENVKHNAEYFYTILAVDDDGNESKPSSVLSLRWKSLCPYPVIAELFHSVNPKNKQISLRWNYNQANVDK